MTSHSLPELPDTACHSPNQWGCRPSHGDGGESEAVCRSRPLDQHPAGLQGGLGPLRRLLRQPWPHGLPAAPETLGPYLTELAEAGYKAATLQRRLSAIREAHRIARHTLDTGHPAVREVWRGIRGVIGTAKTPKAPAVGADILAMLATLGDSTADRRDRALLLLGFASALRRSELVGLDAAPGQTPGDPAGYGWIEFCDEGIRIRLTRSKTDQQGEGRSIGVPCGVHPDTCPVAAVKAWLDHAGIVHGPLFRPVGWAGTIRLDRLTDRSVALIVKRAAEAAELDPPVTPATACAAVTQPRSR